jgi:hypothetical protein
MKGVVMAAKEEQSQKDAQTGDKKVFTGITSDERYQLPRTISPIGLFFGHGAPDPRRADKEGSTEAGEIRDQYMKRTRSRAPIGTVRTRPLISLAVTVACGLFYMIVMKLPLNPEILEFWVFLVWLCVVYLACMLFLKGTKPKA